jgi:cation transport ATPase
MSQSQNRMTHEEFIKRVASIALPIILLIAALTWALFGHNVADSASHIRLSSTEKTLRTKAVE